jgi:hypothetical protein
MEVAAQTERAARFLNVATVGGPLYQHHVSLWSAPYTLSSLQIFYFISFM